MNSNIVYNTLLCQQLSEDGPEGILKEASHHEKQLFLKPLPSEILQSRCVDANAAAILANVRMTLAVAKGLCTAASEFEQTFQLY
jgi:hypothetical protein